MVSEKVIRFQGKNKDLSQLSQQIVKQLEGEGYKTQATTAPLGQIIQAKKAGVLRDIITADRSFSILITGQPNDFSIHIGIGKWIQNLAVAAAETLLLTWLFLAVDVPEMLWTQHVEKEIVKEITQIVENMPTSEGDTKKPEYNPPPIPGDKSPNDLASDRDHPNPNPK